MARGASLTRNYPDMSLSLHRIASSLALALSLSAASPVLAGGEGWIQNMDEAMKKAAAEHKLILMDFTGSDWCGWCIKLDKEVFSQPEFKSGAAPLFVLVDLDFPNQKPQTDEQKAHNKTWQEKFKIEGYPTIILADEKGKGFARTGYRPGGAAEYMTHLNKLLEGKKTRDASLAAAAAASGVEKAKHLDAALSVENIMIDDEPAVMKEIIALDAENKAGLKEKYEIKLSDIVVSGLMRDVQKLMFQDGNMQGGLDLLDTIEKEHKVSGDMAGQILQMRLMAMVELGKKEEAEKLIVATMTNTALAPEARQQAAFMRVQMLVEAKDLDGAIKALDEAVLIAPESEMGKMVTTQREMIIGMFKQQIEAAGAEGGHTEGDGHDHGGGR